MADIRPRGDQTRFIDAFLSVITRAIYQPKRVEQPYRGPTPERRPTRVKGWRDVIGSASWTQPENRRAHEKWLKVEKQCAAARAAQDAASHARGESLSRHNSARTLRRIEERRAAKAAR